MRQKIAIVGSGISGLGAAYLLSQAHDVTVFETDQRLGGHSHTVDIDLDGQRSSTNEPTPCSVGCSGI